MMQGLAFAYSLKYSLMNSEFYEEKLPLLLSIIDGFSDPFVFCFMRY